MNDCSVETDIERLVEEEQVLFWRPASRRPRDSNRLRPFGL